MARAPTPAALKARIRFERRTATDDGYGNPVGAFAPMFGDRRAKLVPTRAGGGGEAVMDARLAGKGLWDLWVYADSDTRTVRASDIVVDARNPDRRFNIRWIGDLNDDDAWLLMQVEEGVNLG